MKRMRSYNEYLTDELQDAEYRREFLLALLRGEKGLEPLSLLEAIKYIVEVMGVKEFAELTGLQSANVSRFYHSEDLPKISSLNKMLKPFSLKVKIDVEVIDVA